jgi:hypothetical protein
MRKTLKLREGFPRPLRRGSAALIFLTGFVLILNLLIEAPFARAQVNSVSEYQLKAAFLFNFAKFVDWPPTAFASSRAPIHFCLLGKDPFGSSLDALIQGKRINDREMDVRRVKKLGDIRVCQVVFIGSSGDMPLSEVFDSLKGGLAVTVGDSADFARRGGEIQLFLEDGRIRFSVNVDAVQRAGLTISAKLLALATIVHDRDIPKAE